MRPMIFAALFLALSLPGLAQNYEFSDAERTILRASGVAEEAGERCQSTWFASRREAALTEISDAMDAVSDAANEILDAPEEGTLTRDQVILIMERTLAYQTACLALWLDDQP